MRRVFILDHETIARANASRFLAIDPRAIGSSMALPDDDGTQRVSTSGNVASIDIMGPLAQRAINGMCAYVEGYDMIEARLGLALADPTVSAVVLNIDSPGGDAAGCFESVRRMQEMVAASGKPVYAFANELMASAAFALACVATHGIFLPPSATVGSVGVLAIHVDESAGLEAAGVKVTVVRSGARKAETNPFEALSPEALASMQEHVDALAVQFAALVGKARGARPKDVLGLRGAVFMGEDAVNAGLADGVKTFNEVVSMAAKAGRKAARDRKNMADFSPLNAKLGLPEDATVADCAASIEARLHDYDVLHDGLVAMIQATGATTVPEALGSIAALQANTAALVEAQTKLAAATKAEADAKAEVELAEVAKIIGAARAAHKIVPANEGKAEALYAKHGKDALLAHLDGLVPVVPAAATAPVVEPAHDGTSATSQGTGAPPVPATKAWADMAPIERAQFHQKHGKAAYEALKAAATAKSTK